MKTKFLHWLMKLFKIPLGNKPNKFILFLYKILFPIKSWLSAQDIMRYDPIENVYYINGVKFSAGILEMWGSKKNVGKAILFKEKGKDNIAFQSVGEEGDEFLIIPRYKAKNIEDALRLTININKCNSRKTSFDRSVVQAHRMIETVLSGNYNKPVYRFKIREDG